MRHINIPLFIPHLGCPNDCVFCDQKTISGKRSFDPDGVDTEIETVLSEVRGQGYEVEIAFFGGSFTGIDRSLMITLLEKAHSYIESGDVKSVRISTRPDYIDKEILSILARYGVTDIELGIQSMNDKVLAACRRGHTADDTRRACRMITEAGFRLVGQMMTGLPCSDGQSELETAREIVDMGACGARIYPLVVFHGTELEGMMLSGAFSPLPEDEVIRRSADVLDIFVSAGLEILRIGLCAQDNLLDGSSIAGGFYHPATGEMVKSELFFKRIVTSESFAAARARGEIKVCCPIGKLSQVIGQRKRNEKRLRDEYGIKNVKIVEKKGLLGYNITVE